MLSLTFYPYFFLEKKVPKNSRPRPIELLKATQHCIIATKLATQLAENFFKISRLLCFGQSRNGHSVYACFMAQLLNAIISVFQIILGLVDSVTIVTRGKRPPDILCSILLRNFSYLVFKYKLKRLSI